MEDDLPKDAEALGSKLQEIQDEVARLELVIAQEEAKFAQWKAENIRRKHNYVPFLLNLLKILAEKGELTPLVDRAIEKKKAARKGH